MNNEQYENLILLMKEALKFYAHKGNYSGGMGSIAPIDSDEYGSQARFALEQLEKIKKINEGAEEEFVKNITNAIETGDNVENIQKMIEDFKILTENDNNV